MDKAVLSPSVVLENGDFDACHSAHNYIYEGTPGPSGSPATSCRVSGTTPYQAHVRGNFTCYFMSIAHRIPSGSSCGRGPVPSGIGLLYWSPCL